jgi:hypothetical protein
VNIEKGAKIQDTKGKGWRRDRAAAKTLPKNRIWNGSRIDAVRRCTNYTGSKGGNEREK